MLPENSQLKVNPNPASPTGNFTLKVPLLGTTVSVESTERKELKIYR